MEPLEQRHLLSVSHLIHISIDGLRPDAITAQGPAELPNFYRLRNEGSFTDNARTDYDYTTTLQNHTDQITSRPVSGPDGHGLTINSDPGGSYTIHEANGGSYVTSAFDVVHDNGGRTGLYASKSKFSLFDRSWNATYGRVDSIGDDDGTDKIDNYSYSADTAQLTNTFITDTTDNPLDYAMVHWADPDLVGHSSGWMSQAYLDSVKAMDGLLGDVFNLIDSNGTFTGDTAIILTADHGGSGTGHGTAADATDYTIPFYAWGPGVLAGGELYSMNYGTRQDPAGSRPDNGAAPQPIRNGDAGNLATQMLGYGPIDDSFFNAAHEFDTTTVDVSLVTMVDQGSDWRYLVTPAEPADDLGGNAWRDLAFDDSAWPEDPAQLGFGDNGEVTTIGYGPSASNKYTTTYFRQEFEVTDASTYSDLDLGLLRDDGAVVYLNGQEVVRSHMPEGDISYSTFSSQPAVGGTDETTFFPYSIDPSLLVDGTNVLTVEIHQVNLTSSDLSFDLELQAVQPAGPDLIPPSANLATPEDNGPKDLDPTPGAVTVGFGQAAFEIQLTDSGLGIDDATAVSGTVILKQGGVTLTDGNEYTFSYDSASNLIALTGAAAFSTDDYQIALNSGAAQIEDRAGNALAATTFDVVIDLALADSFTVVMLPDTQKYSESYPEIFDSQTEWVRDNIVTENLAFLTHVGDVIEHSDAITPMSTQWTRADAAMDILDGDPVTDPDALIPYSVVPGNHDFDVKNVHDPAGDFTAYFGGYRYNNPYYNEYYDWYLGGMYNTTNHAQVFSAGGRQFLHLGLEWEPRQTAIDWAQGLMNTYPDLPVIITTHNYLGASGRSTGTSDGGYSGEAVFQTLVNPNPQVFMVLGGHTSAEYYQVSTNDAGLEVIEILADFQSEENGGNGFMRLLEFLPDQNRIDVKTYSPYLDQYETDADSQFSVSLDFDARFNFTFAPTASLAVPLDNGPNDFDPADDLVTVNTTQSAFQIQLDDVGEGIDDTTVTAATVAMTKDGSSASYSFDYDSGADLITLTPTAGNFGNGVYAITLNGAAVKIADLGTNPMATTTFTVEIDTSIVQPLTATFQQGASGYAGTADTNLMEYYPNTSYASQTFLTIDSDEPSTQVDQDAQALLRFDAIFGAAAGQVPINAAITSAILELNVTNNGDSMNLHRMLQGWVDTNTWNALGGGIQTDGAEAAASADVSTGAVPIGTLSMDVAAAITAWQASPSTNFGWALLPTLQTDTNGLDFDSAEGATPPKLIVEYLTGDQNSPPVALSNNYNVDEDGTLNVVAPGVLANDVDADGDALTAVLSSDVSSGVLVLNADGSFDYTPDADFNGSDSFSYTAEDGNGGTDTATVTITVAAVNDPPVANNQAETTDEDTPLLITLDATDADGDSLNYNVTSGPTGGTLSNVGPTPTYTPGPDFNGTDGFTYTVDDGNGGTDTATVDITVAPVNDPPTADAGGPYAVDEGSGVTLDASLSADVDGSIASYAWDLDDDGSYDDATGPTVVFTSVDDGTFSIGLQVTDNEGASSTDTATVNVNNVAPVADAGGPYAGDEDADITLTASATDAGVNDTLDYTWDLDDDGSFDDAAGPSVTFRSPAGGTFTVTVLVHDGDGASDTDTATVTVNPVNDPPTANDDAFTVAEDSGTTNFAVLANDGIAPDTGETLTVTAVGVGSAGGTIAIAADGGSVDYAPAADFFGTETFTYTINDGTPGSDDSATVTVTVDPIEPLSLFTDGFESGNFAAAGWTTSGDTKVVTRTPYAGTFTAKIKKVAWIEKALSTEGFQDIHVKYARYTKGFDAGEFFSVEWSANGSDWYTLEETQDTSWAAQDKIPGSGADNQSGFRVRFRTNTNREEAYIDAVEIIGTPLGPPNQPPAIDSTAVTTAVQDAPYTYDVDASDPDAGDTLTFSLDVAPSGMTVDPASGAIQWTPTNAQVGSNGVTVRAEDTGGLFDTQLFTINVANVNDPPTITSTPVSTANQDAPYTYDVDASDPDAADTLAFFLDVAPSGMSIDADTGVIQWTPTAAQIGSNDVTVRVEDAGGLFDTQSFTINVANVNNPPTIDSTAVTSAVQDAPYTYDVDASDPDAGDTLTFSLDVGPSGMTVNAISGEIQWTPTNAQVGSNGVTVRVEDVGGLFDTQIFSIDVANVNDPPTITSTAVTAATQDVPYTYDVDATDPDTGDTLTFSLDVLAPSGMSIDVGTGVIQWTPTAAQVGSNDVTVRVEDAGGLFDTQSFTITVNAASFTKFFVVDAGADDMFQYDDAGGLVTQTDLAVYGNTDPRGATSTDGTTVWVIDKNKTVYVYHDDGSVDSWTAGGLRTPEGIATDGTNIWIVDAKQKRVFYYENAALTAVDRGATSSFALDGSNGKAKGITTDGSSIWVVDDNRVDMVFKYPIGGGSPESWTLASANTKPTGITIDPSGGSNIWIVDSGDPNQVFEYAGARDFDFSGPSPTGAVLFTLTGGNTNPQGIADPPPAGVDGVFASHQAAADLFPRGLDEKLFLTIAQEEREERAVDSVLLYLDADLLD